MHVCQVLTPHVAVAWQRSHTAAWCSAFMRAAVFSEKVLRGSTVTSGRSRQGEGLEIEPLADGRASNFRLHGPELLTWILLSTIQAISLSTLPDAERKRILKNS